MNDIPKHEFTNSHKDRDCVVCGKPLKDHGDAGPFEEPKAEPERKKLF